MNWVADAFVYLIPITGGVAFFTFLAVQSWASERRREREAYYRFEFRKELVAAGKMDGDDVRDLMQFEQASEAQRTRQAAMVAGLLLTGIGVGLLLGLRWIDADLAIWQVGYVPLAMGLALFVYVFAFAASSAAEMPPRTASRDHEPR